MSLDGLGLEPETLKTMPRMSLADQILAADDVEHETIPVPEWGVTLELRSPDGEERSALIEKFFPNMDSGDAKPDVKKMYPVLVITCAYDPITGERVFTMDEGTIGALNRKNGAVLERVALRCMKLVGLEEDSVEEGKDDSLSSLIGGSATS